METVETEESSYHFVYNPEKDLIAEKEEGKEKVIQYLYGNQEAITAVRAENGGETTTMRRMSRAVQHCWQMKKGR